MEVPDAEGEEKGEGSALVYVDGLGNNILRDQTSLTNQKEVPQDKDQDEVQNLEGARDNGKSEVKTNINDLPDEILRDIFSSLSVTELNGLREVCRRWDFVMNDKETWNRSFTAKFNTPRVFPSVSNSNNWMHEYFSRSECIRKWKKGVAHHNSYYNVSAASSQVNHHISDFRTNNHLGKFISYDEMLGDVTICNLKNGKNSIRIEGTSPSHERVCFDLSMKYLIVGKTNGMLEIKNLTWSSTFPLSVKTIDANHDNTETEHEVPIKVPIMAVACNPHASNKYKRMDIISGSYTGKLKGWSLMGHLYKTINFTGEIIYNIVSDFKKLVIVNTDVNIYILDFEEFNVLKQIPLGFTIENHLEPNSLSYYASSAKLKNQLDVDFGDSNIIVNHINTIKVFNFKNLNNILVKELTLSKGLTITVSKMQTMPLARSNNRRNRNIVGQDGLLFANILSDDSIIIWNVRSEYEDERRIIPINTLKPKLNHDRFYPSMEDFLEANHMSSIITISLNSLFIAVGGHNGVCKLYDIFTGHIIRSLSIKFPKSFPIVADELAIPTTSIHLNDDLNDCNGLITCEYGYNQYVQFGDLTVTGNGGKKFRNGGAFSQGGKSGGKFNQQIRHAIDDYNKEVHDQRTRRELMDKFNGDDESRFHDLVGVGEDELEDEDLSLAIALSQSQHQHEQLSRDTSHAASQGEEDGGDGDDDNDEEFQLALELSRIMHEESTTLNSSNIHSMEIDNDNSHSHSYNDNSNGIDISSDSL